MSWATDIEAWAHWTDTNLLNAEEIPSPADSWRDVPWFDDFLSLLGDDGPPDDLSDALATAVRNGSDVAARFAGLNLYHLIVHQNPYPLQQELIEDAVDKARDDYRKLVLAVPVEAVPMDPRRIDWEIRLCAPLRLWSRVDELFEKLARCNTVRRPDVAAAQAQHLFIRRYNTATESLEDGAFAASIWSTYAVGSLDSIATVLILASAVSLKELAAPDDAPSAETIYSAVRSSDWPKVRWAKPLMMARASFELELYEDTIEKIEAAIADPVFPSSWREGTFEFLSVAYERLGDSAATAQFLKRWSFEFPRDSRVLIKLAAVAADSSQYEQAYQFLERAVGLSPDLERDLPTRIGLALGQIGAEHVGSWTELKSAITREPAISQALQAAVRTYWDGFNELDDNERVEWIAALYTVNVLSPQQVAFASAWNRQSALAFLTVAEAQLRRRVFEPARNEARTDPNLMREASQKRQGESDWFLAQFILKGRLTLGQMRRIIEADQNKQSGPLALLITRHVTGSPIRDQLDAIRRLDEPRNDAVHNLVTIDARTVHNDARRVIETAIEHSRRRLQVN